MSKPEPGFSVPRRHKRATVRLPAKLQADGGVLHGTCIDLSAGGAGLSLATLPEVGDQVAVEIELPGGMVLTIRGEVMHAGSAGSDRCGLRFGQLDPRALVAIHSLVAAH